MKKVRTTTIARAAAVVGLTLGLAACGARQVPLSELSADQLWARGVQEFNEEEWSEAIEYFERYVLVGGSDPRVHQARYYSADARFRNEEYVTAATEFARLSGDLGRSDLADDARFMACRAYEELSPKPQLDQQYTRAAIQHCQALVEYFPESEFADGATKIVDRMWNRLAAKLYEGGEWYLDREAYDSAIIYFEDVVREYPQTPYAPRALARLVEIYGILEYAEEREQARERLLRDYAESREARGLGKS